MNSPDSWKQFEDVGTLCQILSVTEEEWQEATRESDFNYIERKQINKKTGKCRDLCYPPKTSVLRKVQSALKTRLLSRIPVCPEVLGYRFESHNIKVAADISGLPFVGKVDVSKFHPSTKTEHVAVALKKHGLSWPWARQIARIVTYRGRVPQGAPTSNHIANLVMDTMMRRAIVPFAKKRGVQVRNYGDDIAFGGADAKNVRECVAKAKATIVFNGFYTNEKCNPCEHRGERRIFIGCATGRAAPDYPRDKYRELRKELRTLLHRECSGTSDQPPISDKELLSLKHKISYVARLNKRKARNLREVFHRLCAAKHSKSLAVNN